MIAAEQQLAFIREETRFEVGLMHERVNALISAEAFLTIAFATALSNSNPDWGAAITFVVSPVLALIGIVLALLAMPGISASMRIIEEWNHRQEVLMRQEEAVTAAMWRPSMMPGGRKPPSQRKSMLFARTVPMVFLVAWLVLAAIALVLPMR